MPDRGPSIQDFRQPFPGYMGADSSPRLLRGQGIDVDPDVPEDARVGCVCLGALRRKQGDILQALENRQLGPPLVHVAANLVAHVGIGGKQDVNSLNPCVCLGQVVALVLSLGLLQGLVDPAFQLLPLRGLIVGRLIRGGRSVAYRPADSADRYKHR
jgi:hypothetical protein